MGDRSVVVRGALAADEVAAATELVAAATRQDGVRPLSDQAMLHLRHGGADQARGVLLYAGGALVGYAHLEPGAEPSGELVIHPLHRGHGHGRALVEAVVGEAGGRPRLWAHGELPAAVALARSLGFERVRALWEMRRPLAEPLPEPTVPEDVRIRTFEPGRDETAWLEVNRRAFAHHPEQGAWTADDLTRREQESWFDPAGFFLAERGGALAGFHWTKVHDGESAAEGIAEAGTAPATEPAGEPIGEVYVVGVDPAAQGTGLGRVLTLVGLHHLRSRGLSQVMLYVDETNTGAVRMYENLGFTRRGVDVMYAPAACSPVVNITSGYSS
jgi:mycothiol synthase